MALLVFVSLVGAGLLALTLWLRKGAIRGIPEPPGNFVVGHVFRLGHNFAETFLKWKQMVGPIYQIRVFNQRLVILNDKQSISKVCSMPETTGRVRIGIFKRTAELFGEGVANGEGPLWEEQRQFYSKSFRTYGISKGESEKSALDEIQDLLQEWEQLDGAPIQLKQSSVAYAFNTVWSILGSKRSEAGHALEISRHLAIFSNMDTIWDKIAFVATNFVDKFSDIARAKLDAAKILWEESIKIFAEHQEDRVANQPRDVIDEILDKMDQTEDPKSFFHKTNLAHGFMLHELIAATMDTSTRTLEWFMLYMTQNPEIVSKLQCEIDSVLGQQLRPSLSDRDKMPYTQACIWETMRIATALPSGIPHTATKDFELDGAFIPKGTIFITNFYAAHRDPEIWDRPDEFVPERYITSSGEFDTDVRNKTIPFGVGRRSCLGSSIALDTMFLYVASVFQKFNVELVGKVDSMEGIFGFVLYPPPGLKIRATLRKQNLK